MDYDVTLQTIAWFNTQRVAGTLEISPKFQRRAVWLDEERSQLIGSVLRRLPFPEVYIQVATDSQTGAQRNVVVDGQQRITSILRFIDNQVAAPNEPDFGLRGQYFRDLSDDDKTRFWNYKVVTRTLNTTSDAEIRDLFGRLNTNNYALNDQELRNARYTGKFKQAAERIADEAIFSVLGLFTPREIRRMEDVEFASELLLLVVAGITNKKDLLDDAYMNMNEEFPEQARREREVQTTLQLVGQVVRDENAALVKTKSTFYSLFGAALRHHRATGRSTFRNADAVGDAVTSLLTHARSVSQDATVVPAEALEYREAVVRAASDRSRRVRREELLYAAISQADS